MLSPRLSLHVSAAAVALSALFATVPAHAGISACGNIDVTADAQCEVLTSGGCEANCTPPKLEAACAAKLEVDCETMCDEVPSVDCTGSCQTDCETECNVKPASFDCEGNCTATCQGDCSSKCKSSDNSSECEAQCNASCSGECHGSCTGMPAEADCTGKCEASCTGSCKVDTNFDCQTSCQGQGFAQCQADLKEGSCDVQCKKPEGAVFCDGQFVDNGGNAKACIDALDAYLKAHVMVSASGTSSCDNGVCEAEGTAKASCHCSTPARRSGSTSTAFAIAGVLGLLGVSRMRRR
ncbi:MAG TPA: hypothetical protein VH062_31250 [Polyangiaceae bacterium]|jgi:hypothetical protein|nr:hypothetical protein [Polyangiaceae bacterium]